MHTLKLTLVLLLLTSTLTQYTSNAPALAADLQARLDRYRKDLMVLQEQTGQLKAEIDKLKARPSLSFASVQEGMAQQRDILHTIQGYLSLPFNMTSCDCYELSDSQRSRVLKQIGAIREGLEGLERSSGLDENCRQYREVRKELLREKRYIQTVETALISSSCGKQLKRRQISVAGQTPSGIANIAQSEFQTNLKAENLCYGRLTEEQVKLLWFAFSVKNNVTNCPLSAPFYDGSKCISCSGGTPFFDLSLQRCIAAKGVDQNKQCIYPSFGGAGRRDVGTTATFKEVSVSPLVGDPIVKSVTFNKVRRTREKTVSPIEGKALLEKQKRITNTKYVQVPAIVSPPDVKLVRNRARSQDRFEARDSQVAPTVQEPVVSTPRVRSSSQSSRSSSTESQQYSAGSSRSSNGRTGAQSHEEQV